MDVTDKANTYCPFLITHKKVIVSLKLLYLSSDDTVAVPYDVLGFSPSDNEELAKCFQVKMVYELVAS